jgi:hypothetical protein
MASLRKKREKATGADTTVYRRALGLVFIQAYETAEGFERDSQADLAARFYEIAAEAVPTNMEITYTVASAWAAAGDKKKSLTALRRAIELGFDDTQTLAHDKHFEALRTSTEFKAIIASMR